MSVCDIMLYHMLPISHILCNDIQIKSHAETSRTGNETLACNVAHYLQYMGGYIQGVGAKCVVAMSVQDR